MIHDEPTDLLLIIALQYPCEDYYFPESAIHLLSSLRDLDDEAWAVTIELWAMDAEADLTRN